MSLVISAQTSLPWAQTWDDASRSSSSGSSSSASRVCCIEAASSRIAARAVAAMFPSPCSHPAAFYAGGRPLSKTARRGLTEGAGRGEGERGREEERADRRGDGRPWGKESGGTAPEGWCSVPPVVGRLWPRREAGQEKAQPPGGVGRHRS